MRRRLPRKYYYRLTDAGRIRVRQLTEAWQKFSAAVDAVLAGARPAEEES